MTLECSHCGHKTKDAAAGDWCRADRLLGYPICTGTYGLAEPREPWDQGGPDSRLATIGELRRLAGWMKTKKEEEA